MVREGRVEMGIAFRAIARPQSCRLPRWRWTASLAIVPQQRRPLAKKKQLSRQELLDPATLLPWQRHRSAARLMLEEALATSAGTPAGRRAGESSAGHRAARIRVGQRPGRAARCRRCARRRWQSLGAVCHPAQRAADREVRRRDPCRTYAVVEGGAGAAGNAKGLFARLGSYRRKKTGLVSRFNH